MFDGFIIETVANQNITYSCSEKKKQSDKQRKPGLCVDKGQTYQALRSRCGYLQERGFSSAL